ncbi:hypothetical protein HN51_039633 [Arachis hypogaea]|uniref:Uncharacterized protein n=1 Tax=Arachis hypogaea TaxID=3818 RepID=A0A444YK33_ARAHY|nr:cingulin-like protein 1 [Arachis ipaensis]XP_025661177.1 cingulin-like protein 1 [Arachis hypogaea]RYR02310.1 hypothetical protein Ahy_B06g081122 isoform B [Arachis hypogaea]
MAKKKLSHQSKHEQQVPQQPLSMDDSTEKLQSLKDLNSMLLKETAHRRQQVQSLLEAKEALQSALNRSSMQQNALHSHLAMASDDTVLFEIQNLVAFVLMEQQIRESGHRFAALVAERNEIDKLNACLEAEMDQIKADFDGVVADANALKEKLFESENNERKLTEEVKKLKLEQEKMVVEGNKKEREFGKVVKERDLALRKNAESERVIGELRGEMDAVLKLKTAKESRISEMEVEMKQLKESLCGLHEEEAVMSAKILELEGSLGLAEEKEEAMEMEIEALAKQKEEIEVNVEMLKEGRDSLQKALDKVQRELENRGHEIDMLVREKNEIEMLKVERESEIVELQREVDGLKDVVLRLKASCSDFEERNKHLLSEVNHYKDSIEEVMLERDDIKKGYDEEKNKVKSLALQVEEMEDKIKEMATELSQMISEKEKLVEKNKTIESRVGVLINEMDTLQQSIVEARRVSEDLRAKVEFSNNKSNQALALLKSTAALVCQYNESVEEVLSIEQKADVEEVQPYVEQLNAIKKAFRSKNKMVADMKQQLELMHCSVVSANKMKSLWTVVSSATTILAAALAAYVAKGH